MSNMNVNNQQSSTATQSLEQAASTFMEQLIAASSSSKTSLPTASNTVEEESTSSYDTPTLEAPQSCALSLDSLVNAIGFKESRLACQSGVETLKDKAEDQKVAGEKQLAEMAEQLDEMAKQEVLDGFKKAFQIIGILVGAIASAASIVAGVLTANPLLIASGVMSGIMVVDSAVSLGTDGEHGIAAWTAMAAEALGASEETAQWIGFGIQMAFTVATCITSITGAAKAATTIAVRGGELGQKVLNGLVTAEKVANVVNAGVMVGQGSTDIGLSVVNYKVAMSQADQKEFEAILEKLQNAIDIQEKLLEAQMERSSDLLTAVSDIVEECNQTNTAIMTASPTMA